MTSAEDYFEAIKEVGSGTLYYLTRKSDTSYLLEALILDTTNKDLTIKILQRAMNQPNFVAFPGTPEFYEATKDLTL